MRSGAEFIGPLLSTSFPLRIARLQSGHAFSNDKYDAKTIDDDVKKMTMSRFEDWPRRLPNRQGDLTYRKMGKLP